MPRAEQAFPGVTLQSHWASDQRGEAWGHEATGISSPAACHPSSLLSQRRGGRSEESWAELGEGRAGCGRGWGTEGTAALVPVPPLSSGQCNHLVSGKGKGFSYQRKLKVTLFLIDLAMFVNYSVTDVAKDN